MNRPKIAITLGDVAGIGPEVTVRALQDPRIQARCQCAVIGDSEVVANAVKLAQVELDVVDAPTLQTALEESKPRKIGVWNPGRISVADVPSGSVNAQAGRAAHDWLIAAINAAKSNHIDAITTAPLSKAALHAAGFKYPGHTEILAERCNAKSHAMMLYLPPSDSRTGLSGLGIAHVTLHTSIASVPSLITTERVAETITLVDHFLKRLGIESPRIGVCALNPHAGEDGLFGEEEQRLIAPAVQQFDNAHGPFPADTLIRRAVNGEFDGLVAMYHDQGHIALKLIGFGSAVNVTLGLPIIRTSPSHGTGFDIAGQGEAEPHGMIEAILTAADLVQHKQTMINQHFKEV